MTQKGWDFQRLGNVCNFTLCRNEITLLAEFQYEPEEEHLTLTVRYPDAVPFKFQHRAEKFTPRVNTHLPIATATLEDRILTVVSRLFFKDMDFDAEFVDTYVLQVAKKAFLATEGIRFIVKNELTAGKSMKAVAGLSEHE